MSAPVFVALKQFGGGKALRTKYGGGFARMVQRGTRIASKDMSETLRADLEAKGLIVLEDAKATYETQADRDARIMKAGKAEDTKSKAKADAKTEKKA